MSEAEKLRQRIADLERMRKLLEEFLQRRPSKTH